MFRLVAFGGTHEVEQSEGNLDSACERSLFLFRRV